MYSLLVYVEHSVLAAFFMMSFIAAIHASRLASSRTESELRRRTNILRRLTLALTAAAAASVAVYLGMAAVFHPVFWHDRLLLRLPLLAAPAAFIWLMAMPRIRLLLSRTKTDSERRPDVARRRHAADASLIAPFKFALLGALGVAYFIAFPPVPVSGMEAAAPLFIVAAAGALIWVRQTIRYGAAAGAAAQVREYRYKWRVIGSSAALIAMLGLPLVAPLGGSELRTSAVSGVGLTAHSSVSSVGLTGMLRRSIARSSQETGPQAFIVDKKLFLHNLIPQLLTSINGKPHIGVSLLQAENHAGVTQTIYNRSAVRQYVHLDGQQAVVLKHSGKQVDDTPYCSAVLETFPGQWYEIAWSDSASTPEEERCCPNCRESAAST